ncbi:MAG: FAD-dependent oxidoreductase, partial [Dehalococcoidia bacterium]
QGPVSGDAMLLAVGRRADLSGLELERAGVEYGPNGIRVNQSLRTSQRHIYAAGDCLGGFQFTHYAGWQGFMAVRNALLPGATKAVLDRVPWTTFTEPEVAHIGLTEQQARDRNGNRVEVTNWPMAQVDRALTDGASAGFVKLVHQPNGKLLGATVVSRRAGEMIHEWILALDQGRKIGDLANSIHVYPTYSMANMQVSSQLRVAGLLSGASGRIVRKLARLMR